MKPQLLQNWSDDKRGQILLVAAVGIVLVLLSFALILNAAGFTERERVDGVDYHQKDVLSHVSDTEYGLEDALRQTNHERGDEYTDYTGDYDNDAREERLTGDDGEIAGVEDRLAEQLSLESAYVTIDDVDVNDNGVRIWQPGYDDLQLQEEAENGNGGGGPPGPPPGAGEPDPPGLAADPGIVDDGDAIRDFTITVTGEDLEEIGSGDEFGVEIDGGGFSDDTIRIGGDPDDPNNVVMVEGPDGHTCTSPIATDTGFDEDRYVTVEFTSGKLDGEHCEALPGTENMADIDFENADNIEAALNMVVDVGDDDPDDVIFPDADDDAQAVQDGPSENPGQPEAHHAIYSYTVETSVTSPDADVTTTMRITPGLYGDAETIYDEG